jgi:hypothetical protein
MSIRPKIKAVALVLMAGSVAACEGGFDNPFAMRSVSESFMPITTEEEFRSQVVGREVVYDNGAIGTYGEDGSWAVANADGLLASGTWTWTDGQWCYEGSSATGPISPACDTVAVSSTGVRFTKADGTSGVLPFRA